MMKATGQSHGKSPPFAVLVLNVLVVSRAKLFQLWRKWGKLAAPAVEVPGAENETRIWMGIEDL
jgi:hypothetical protein